MGLGKLVFKGDNPKAKKKKKKKTKHEKSSQEVCSTPTSTSNTDIPKLHNPISSGPIVPLQQPAIQHGVGKITSSGTVLTGHGTNFMSTLQSGDAIIVSIGGKDQMRVLTMRLSDTSASISTSFSESIKKPTGFSYICKPRNHHVEERKRKEKACADQEELDRSAFGTYAATSNTNKGGNVMVYRERTEHGSYRIRKEQVDGNVSRTSLLNMRTSKKSDRYC